MLQHKSSASSCQLAGRVKLKNPTNHKYLLNENWNPIKMQNLSL